jgi:hypothetical protein
MPGALYEDQYIFFVISRSILLRTKRVSDKRCRENRKRHFVFSNSFSKIVPFMKYVEKYGRAGRQTTDENIAHAHYMLIAFPLRQ